MECVAVDGGLCRLPDFAWNEWGRAQTERVLDLMDILYLRHAIKGAFCRKMQHASSPAGDFALRKIKLGQVCNLGKIRIFSDYFADVA